jgi:hypothetical protein
VQLGPGSTTPLANDVDDVYVEPDDLLRLRCPFSAAVSAGLTFEFLAGHAQRPHPIRLHLQSLDFGPNQIQNQAAPAIAGTKHLALEFQRYGRVTQKSSPKDQN